MLTVEQNSRVSGQRQAAGGLLARIGALGTEEAARELLGTLLVSRLPGGAVRRAVIVETEAYLGISDPACHTYRGRRTDRVLPMWGPPGRAYVYRVYGRNDCFNVVTRRRGVPEAVLVRAVVPLSWWIGDVWTREEVRAGSGPGRACRLLGITTELSGFSLGSGPLRLRSGPPRGFEVVRGARVGVGYAGEAAAWPLRFAVAGCPAVTRPRSLLPVIAT